MGQLDQRQIVYRHESDIERHVTFAMVGDCCPVRLEHGPITVLGLGRQQAHTGGCHHKSQGANGIEARHPVHTPLIPTARNGR